jgi:MmyB-like transcription regulator ligand binding domain
VARAVHAVRLNAGTYQDDPEIKALVAYLLSQSPEFRALWEEQTARGLSRAYVDTAAGSYPELFAQMLVAWRLDTVAELGEMKKVLGRARTGSAACCRSSRHR